MHAEFSFLARRARIPAAAIACLALAAVAAPAADSSSPTVGKKMQVELDAALTQLNGVRAAGEAVNRKLDQLEELKRSLIQATGELGEVMADPTNLGAARVGRNAGELLRDVAELTAAVVRHCGEAAAGLQPSADPAAARQALQKASDEAIAAARNLTEARTTAAQISAAAKLFTMSDPSAVEKALAATQGAIGLALDQSRSLIVGFVRERDDMHAHRERLVRQFNAIVAVTPNGPERDRMLVITGRAENELAAIEPRLEALVIRRSTFAEAAAAAWRDTTGVIMRIRELREDMQSAQAVAEPAAKLVADAAASAAVLCAQLTARLQGLGEQVEKLEVRLKESADFHDKAVARVPALKEQRQKREALLKLPNLDASDAEQYRQQIEMLDAMLKYNEQQRADAAKLSGELGKNLNAMLEETGLLAPAISALNGAATGT